MANPPVTMPRMATGLITDHRFLEHRTTPGHPERPDRLRAVEAALRESGLLDRCRRLDARPAERALLERLHTPAYIDRCFAACAAGEPYIDSPDSAISPESADVALLAAGSAVAAVDAVTAGEVRNAFVAARPPGHHAERDRSMGFCLFNSVALAAEHALHRHGLKRVAIVDWDVHHGNGTQHLFESRSDVLFISLHEDPRVQYPGTGFAHEDGLGDGKGFTLNLPFRPGTGDQAYELAFHREVVPALEHFEPELVLVSAGFDAAAPDPLGHLELTPTCFAWMTRQLLHVAEEHAGGRLVSLLEGGYDLRSLGECVVAHVGALVGDEARVNG